MAWGTDLHALTKHFCSFWSYDSIEQSLQDPKSTQNAKCHTEGDLAADKRADIISQKQRFYKISEL